MAITPAFALLVLAFRSAGLPWLLVFWAVVRRAPREAQEWRCALLWGIRRHHETLAEATKPQRWSIVMRPARPAALATLGHAVHRCSVRPLLYARVADVVQALTVHQARLLS